MKHDVYKYVPILGFAFMISVESLVSVLLSNSAYCSAPVTKVWLVAGDTYYNITR